MSHITDFSSAKKSCRTKFTSNSAFDFPISLDYQHSYLQSTLPKKRQISQSLEITNLKNVYENQINVLKKQIQSLQEENKYEKQAYERQFDNLKVFLEYEYTVKSRQLKIKLREQFQNCFNQNSKYSEQQKILLQENQNLRNKFERAQKYGLQVQQLWKDIHQKASQEWSKQKAKIIETYQHQIHTVIAQSESERKIKQVQYSTTIQLLENKNKQLYQQIQTFTQQLKEIKIKFRNAQIQLEEETKIKNRIIDEQNARIQVLRNTSVDGQLDVKRRIRKNKMNIFEESLQRKQEILKKSITSKENKGFGKQIFLNKNFTIKQQTNKHKELKIKKPNKILTQANKTQNQFQIKLQEEDFVNSFHTLPISPSSPQFGLFL